MPHRFGVGRAETFQKAGGETPPIYPRINFSIGLGPPPMQKPEPVLKAPAPQQPAPPPVCFPYAQSDEHSEDACQYAAPHCDHMKFLSLHIFDRHLVAPAAWVTPATLLCSLSPLMSSCAWWYDHNAECHADCARVHQTLLMANAQRNLPILACML